MTKVIAGLERVLNIDKPRGKERAWWSVSNQALVPLVPFTQVSKTLPEGAIITEVQIQYDTWVNQRNPLFRVYLSLVPSATPSQQDIVDGERVIPWRAGTNVYWWEPCYTYCNERWPCHKTIKGANTHIGLTMLNTDAFGAMCRVAVQYQMP